MKFTTTDIRINKLHSYLYQVLQEQKPKSPDVSTKMDTVSIKYTYSSLNYRIVLKLLLL